ncbi:reverse transcriptase domain-containing protein [Tanacetum coccineum]
MAPLIVQIWARSGFDRIEEFLGCLKDCQFYATQNYSKVSKYNWEKILFKLEGEAFEPEGRILNKSEVSGKLAKYIVELGAYNIAYVPRNAIKGQILADFINEIPTKRQAERASAQALIRSTVGSPLDSTKDEGTCVEGEGGLKTVSLPIECTLNLIENIPRNQNQKVDVLSKLALVAFNHVTKEVLVEVLNMKSVDAKEPVDENEARTLQMKISQYMMEEGVIFKKSYIALMLRCVGQVQANYIIREVHEGACGMQAKSRSVVAKIMRQGYYWPTMYRDAKEEIEKFDSCQIHAPVPRLLKTRLTSIMYPWPFYQWGLNILGPLPEGPDKLKFIIVAIDYFTKWMEAKPLAKTTCKEVKKFVWENIVCRFRLSRVIVTGNETQLVNEPFKSWCEKFKIKQINMAVAHPQANGLVERANKSLMHGLKE